MDGTRLFRWTLSIPLALLIAAAGALVLSACGGGGKPAGPDDPGPGGPPGAVDLFPAGPVATAPVVGTVKLGSSRQVVIPKGIHDQLGLKPGDDLEVELREEKVVLMPKVLIDKHLGEAMEDLREGRVHGPFGSADAMLDSLHHAAAPTPSRRSGKA